MPLPEMAVGANPEWVIVMLLSGSRSPSPLSSFPPSGGIVSAYVPAASWIVSVPPPAGQPPNAESRLAAWIASRSEHPLPPPYSSANVFGVITAASAGEAVKRTPSPRENTDRAEPPQAANPHPRTSISCIQPASVRDRSARATA